MGREGEGERENKNEIGSYSKGRNNRGRVKEKLSSMRSEVISVRGSPTTLASGTVP